MIGRPRSSLRDLSRELAICRRTVETIIVRETEKGFREWRQEILRSNITEVLIRQPSITIKELSFSVGYGSPEAFSRATKNMFGVSPTTLRCQLIQRPSVSHSDRNSRI